MPRTLTDRQSGGWVLVDIDDGGAVATVRFLSVLVGRRCDSVVSGLGDVVGKISQFRSASASARFGEETRARTLAIRFGAAGFRG